MAYIKSDQVKQSVDNRKRYHLFTEDKLKLLIRKEFDQCGFLLRKIILAGDINHLLSQLPLTVEERNNLVVYSRSLLPVWYRAGVVCTKCLLICGTYSIGFILGSYIFHYSSETIKASKPFAFISLSWNRYETDT